jgi:Dolichyl-phosphate-mannose-protein mannosyltransferase
MEFSHTAEAGDDSVGSPRPRRVRSGTAIGVAVVVFGALVVHIPGFVHQLFDSDEGAIATAGLVVQRGGTLYRDVIDRKPPIPAFVYAGSFIASGTRDLRPLHVVAALCLAGSALLLAYAARKVAGPRAGWWAAGLLIAGATALRPTDAQAANFAHLALLPGCGAIVAARAGSRRSALLAGVLVGIATLTRQTWVIGVVPSGYAAWWWGGRRLERPLMVLAGTAATVAAVAVVVPFGPFWHWTFSGDSSVLALGESQNVALRGGLALELFLLANVATVWLLARRGWHRDDVDLWLWLGTGLVAFVAGWRFFGHYWFQVLPPLCLLAGLGAEACRASIRKILLVAVAAPAVAAWALAFSPHPIDPTVRAMAAYAEAHTRPEDRVTVWGNAPEVYWLSGRTPGGAMVNTDFVTGKSAGRTNGPQRLADATPGARATFLRSLEHHPPELFFDTSTAGLRQAGRYPVTLVPGVEAFLKDRYRPVATVHGVRVYRLRSPASGDAPISSR